MVLEEYIKNGVTSGAKTVYLSGALKLFPSFNGICVDHFVQVHALTSVVPRCDVRYDFRLKRCLIRLYSHYVVGVHFFIYVICIYLRITVSKPYQVMFVSYLATHRMPPWEQEVLYLKSVTVSKTLSMYTVPTN